MAAEEIEKRNRIADLMKLVLKAQRTPFGPNGIGDLRAFPGRRWGMMRKSGKPWFPLVLLLRFL